MLEKQNGKPRAAKRHGVIGFFMSVVLALALFPVPLHAENKSDTSSEDTPPAAKSKPAKKAEAAAPSKEGNRIKKISTERNQTSINFEETLLEGKMKAPAGTFLQGRKAQDKNQMVQLRTQFRRELKRSRGGVQAIAN